MFSKRFQQWRLEDNVFARKVAEKRGLGETLLDLTDSNPSRVGLEWQASALADALSSPKNGFYEPVPQGLRACREAVSQYYHGHGADVPPGRIHLCASTSEGYAWTLKLLADPGDNVLVPAPSYPLLQFLAGMENAVVLPYPLRFANGRWCVDAGALEAAVTPRTRAIFCVTPNNPTGSVLDADDRAALRAISRRHGLPLVVDEVFLDFPAIDGSPSKPLPSWAGEDAVPLLALNGMSKLALLPQMKLGWLAVAGPPAWRDEACKRLELIADTYLSVNTPVQHAAPSFFAGGAARAAALQRRIHQNETRLREWCAAAPHRPRLLRREAGWTAMLALPPGLNESMATLDLLQRGGVLVHPGYFYDTPECGPAFWVISLVIPPETLAAALPRMEETLLRL
ncbi:MAG: pyridoxal phosphate-dependent aminotransferase [Puniceicoccales bacterium]|jgi:aspartate/methionine/tyrosine aminotransferase|nr:pyridoxal phosphate-dependent aminotransferase [Puniceicoccales bacterium]